MPRIRVSVRIDPRAKMIDRSAGLLRLVILLGGNVSPMRRCELIEDILCFVYVCLVFHL